MTDRTDLSLRAANMSLTFEAAVRRLFTIGNVDMTPVEASTGGGERALQHIRLVTTDGKTFILGSANLAERRAELRTLGHSLALSKRRFGRELRLPPREYMKFVEAATKVFEEFGLRVDVVAYSAEAPRPSGVVAKPRVTLPFAPAMVMR